MKNVCQIVKDCLGISSFTPIKLTNVLNETRCLFKLKKINVYLQISKIE